MSEGMILEGFRSAIQVSHMLLEKGAALLKTVFTTPTVPALLLLSALWIVKEKVYMPQTALMKFAMKPLQKAAQNTIKQGQKPEAGAAPAQPKQGAGHH